MTTKITLARSGKFMLLDFDDAKRLSGFKFHINCGYVKFRPNGGYSTKTCVHRYILNAGPDEIVDHIDRNPLNNSRSNLRIATRSENTINSKKRLDNTLGFIGIAQRPSGRWFAQVGIGNRRVRSATVNTMEEAAKLYDEIAAKLHGKFARLNFPKQDCAA